MRHLFVVDSLDVRIQNEKELIHPVSAGGRGLFCICVGSINLNLNLFLLDLLDPKNQQKSIQYLQSGKKTLNYLVSIRPISTSLSQV